MGTSTQIYLPGETRVDDVAKVLGLLAGLPGEWRKFRHSRSGWRRESGDFLAVPGAEVTASNVAGLAEISLHGEMVDGAIDHYVIFHFEGDRPRPDRDEAGGEAYRCLAPPVTPFWKAVGRGLVEFFGGKLDLDDCDSVDVDFERPRPRPFNNPSDGEPWTRFQEEMALVRPVRLEEETP